MGWWMLNNGMVNWDGKMARNCQKIWGFGVSRRVYRDPWHAQESLDGQPNLEGIHMTMCQNWCTCWTCKWLVVYRIWNFWNHPNSWVAIILRGILIISLNNCIYIYINYSNLPWKCIKYFWSASSLDDHIFGFSFQNIRGEKLSKNPFGSSKRRLNVFLRSTPWGWCTGSYRNATSVKGATRQGIPE